MTLEALDALFVRDVMETDVVTVGPERKVTEVHAAIERRQYCHSEKTHRAFPE